MGALLEPAILDAHVAANMLAFRRLRFIRSYIIFPFFVFPVFRHLTSSLVGRLFASSLSAECTRGNWQMN